MNHRWLRKSKAGSLRVGLGLALVADAFLLLCAPKDAAAAPKLARRARGLRIGNVRQAARRFVSAKRR